MTSLTPGDDYLDANSRTIPRRADQYPISLSDGVADALELPRDVKSCGLYNFGTEPVLFNASYNDGNTDSPGDLTGSAGPYRLTIPAASGNTPGYFPLIQQTEFNTLHMLSDAAATVVAYPGGGQDNDL